MRSFLLDAEVAKERRGHRGIYRFNSAFSAFLCVLCVQKNMPMYSDLGRSGSRCFRVDDGFGRFLGGVDLAECALVLVREDLDELGT